MLFGFHRLLIKLSALFIEGWICSFQFLNGLMFLLFGVFHFLKLWLCLHCTPVGSTKPLKSKQLARHLRLSVICFPCFSSSIFTYIAAGDARHLCSVTASPGRSLLALHARLMARPCKPPQLSLGRAAAPCPLRLSVSVASLWCTVVAQCALSWNACS